MAKQLTAKPGSVAVIGLGGFGGAVAESLVRLGHEVLAIDADSALVQAWASHLPFVVQADTTSVETLQSLGLHELESVVVGIGSNIEASLLTVLALTELKIPDIWAKALGPEHGLLLERTGAHHVIYPEAAMGERVAHLVTGKVIDFIEFDDEFAIVKTKAPRQSVDKSLSESALRTKYGVTVVGVKRPRTDFKHATPETVIRTGDLLIISGPTPLVERFAALE